MRLGDLARDEPAGTLGGYDVNASGGRQAVTVATTSGGAPTRAAEDPGSWVEVPPGEPVGTAAPREERKSRSKRAQRQEEDTGEWVETPAQRRSK